MTRSSSAPVGAGSRSPTRISGPMQRTPERVSDVRIFAGSLFYVAISVPQRTRLAGGGRRIALSVSRRRRLVADCGAPAHHHEGPCSLPERPPPAIGKVPCLPFTSPGHLSGEELGGGQRAISGLSVNRHGGPELPDERQRSHGQALVELALIVPIMLALLLGALDLGRVFYANITITSAAKEAALRASLATATGRRRGSTKRAVGSSPWRPAMSRPPTRTRPTSARVQQPLARP